jgi:GNAT superfamily N-acetyltransferase
MGFKTWNTESAIIPILVGDDLKTFQFSKMLMEEGVYVNPVVSPAVPPGMAALRTSYTATHKQEELDFALEKLKKVGTALGLIGPNAPGAPVEVYPLQAGGKEEAGGQKQFLKVPGVIYARDRQWVPPLMTDVETIFDRKKNVFFRHGDAQAFLARRGDAVVGRIVSAFNQRSNRHHNEKAGWFGFFEVDDDYGAAAALLDAARTWLREHGQETMRGPLAFSQLDGMGCLLEGFDSPPAIMMPYNPPYYAGFFEKFGLAKSKDLYAYWLDVRASLPERLHKLAGHVLAKPGVEVRPLRPVRFRKDMTIIMDILNDAHQQGLGFTPLSREDLKYFMNKLKVVIVPELVNFVEVNGKPVAFSMVLPDYNEVLKRFNGRIGITDMMKFYWYSKKIKTLRFALLGVRQAYQKRGLETLLYLESFKRAQELGYTGAELSWVPEDNHLLTRALDVSGARRSKTYRVFEMPI